jgi:hypothetical protein
LRKQYVKWVATLSPRAHAIHIGTEMKNNAELKRERSESHLNDLLCSLGVRMDCWYCGTWLAKPWRSISLGEEHEMPMCDTHDKTTRVAMRLRATGEIETADMLDSAIGIDTRPEFVTWIPPRDEQMRHSEGKLNMLVETIRRA